MSLSRQLRERVELAQLEPQEPRGRRHTTSSFLHQMLFRLESFNPDDPDTPLQAIGNVSSDEVTAFVDYLNKKYPANSEAEAKPSIYARHRYGAILEQFNSRQEEQSQSEELVSVSESRASYLRGNSSHSSANDSIDGISSIMNASETEENVDEETMESENDGNGLDPGSDSSDCVLVSDSRAPPKSFTDVERDSSDIPLVHFFETDPGNNAMRCVLHINQPPSSRTGKNRNTHQSLLNCELKHKKGSSAYVPKTSNLKLHLNSWHYEEYTTFTKLNRIDEQKQYAVDQRRLAIEKANKRKLEVSNFWSNSFKKTKVAADFYQAKVAIFETCFIISSNLSFRTSDNVCFDLFLEHIGSKGFNQRLLSSKWLDIIFQTCWGELLKIINNTSSFSLCTDEWTTRGCTDSYIGLVFHYVDSESLSPRHLLMDFLLLESKTALGMALQICGALDRCTSHQTLFGLGQDNAANVVAAARKCMLRLSGEEINEESDGPLEEDAEGRIWGCYDHTLELCIRSSLAAMETSDQIANRSVMATIENIRAWTSALRQSSNVRKKLKEVARQVKRKTKAPTKDVCVRWDSTHDCMESFLINFPCLVVLADRGDLDQLEISRTRSLPTLEELRQIKIVIKVLREAKMLNKFMQGVKYHTLGHVLFITEQTITNLEQGADRVDSSFEKEFRRNLANQLKLRLCLGRPRRIRKISQRGEHVADEPEGNGYGHDELGEILSKKARSPSLMVVLVHPWYASWAWEKYGREVAAECFKVLAEWYEILCEARKAQELENQNQNRAGAGVNGLQAQNNEVHQDLNALEQVFGEVQAMQPEDTFKEEAYMLLRKMRRSQPGHQACIPEILQKAVRNQQARISSENINDFEVFGIPGDLQVDVDKTDIEAFHESYQKDLHSFFTTDRDMKKLLPLVQLIFSLPASSAEVERVFSQASLINSAKRNRLSPEKLRKLIIIKHYLMKLERENGNRAKESIKDFVEKCARAALEGR